jgi:hypothetical protein
MSYWNKICGFVLFLIFTAHFSVAQTSSILKLNSTDFLQKKKLNTDSLIYFSSSFQLKEGLKNNIQQIVPTDFSTCNYGFFCKKELEIEKITKIPFRFRLGSLEQCNYYEGKQTIRR